MSLIVYNGSPRGEKSNSSIITSWFLEGYGSDNTEIRFLKKFKQHLTYAEEMIKHDQVLIVFPLYVDGMPGQVKHFYEILSSIKEKVKDKQITFIIHSGFSDGIQSRVLEHHCNIFANIMELNNHGVIIIPGSEGFRLMPPAMTKKKRLAVSRLGASYKANEKYNASDIKFLFGKEKSSKSGRFIYRILGILGLTNTYWNSQLKRNKAKKNCFDAPYKDNPSPITTNAYITNK
jgi:multimeric flavodoxin WrbA